MSFSRRIGASPSMKKRVRCSPLRMTALPMMIRSFGLSSTLRAMWVHSLDGLSGCDGSWLSEEAQHRLVGLRGERQGLRRELLPGLQRQEVGTFLAGIREGEEIRTRIEGEG